MKRSPLRERGGSKGETNERRNARGEERKGRQQTIGAFHSEPQPIAIRFSPSGCDGSDAIQVPAPTRLFWQVPCLQELHKWYPQIVVLRGHAPECRTYGIALSHARVSPVRRATPECQGRASKPPTTDTTAPRIPPVVTSDTLWGAHYSQVAPNRLPRLQKALRCYSGSQACIMYGSREEHDNRNHGIKTHDAGDHGGDSMTSGVTVEIPRH